jgi:hypothetical protein
LSFQIAAATTTLAPLCGAFLLAADIRAPGRLHQPTTKALPRFAFSVGGRGRRRRPLSQKFEIDIAFGSVRLNVRPAVAGVHHRHSGSLRPTDTSAKTATSTADRVEMGGARRDKDRPSRAPCLPHAIFSGPIRHPHRIGKGPAPRSDRWPAKPNSCCMSCMIHCWEGEFGRRLRDPDPTLPWPLRARWESRTD